ncbi:ASCH domain-containing protein [Nocardioides marmoraquaticus]
MTAGPTSNSAVSAGTVGRVVLMSIHPQYAQAILDGTKQVEFRKRPVADDVTHVLVYATAPVSAVIGAFTVTGQDVEHPKTLWRRFKKIAGISEDGFFTYYDGRVSGTGIRVGDRLAPAEPLPLTDTFGVARPPQSYQYLTGDIVEDVLSEMAFIGSANTAADGRRG